MVDLSQNPVPRRNRSQEGDRQTASHACEGATPPLL